MMEEGKTDVKSKAETLGPQVTLLVKSQNNNELAFKVKPTTVFSKIVNAYCKNQGIEPRAVRFHDEDGMRIDVNKTIQDLELEPDTDEDGLPRIFVNAFLEQVGGC
ncbi:hypothetical protein RUND412_002374 [Rhizina undulata]